jgi:hypothetical protein
MKKLSKILESIYDTMRLFGIIGIFFIFGCAISAILLIICFLERDKNCYFPNDTEKR